ncbi:MAG: hypothetical protein ABIT38_06935 [Gemmatimonadaceae bacterium]
MKRVVMLLAAASLGACNREPKLTNGTDTGLALATSARSKDSLILVKDSLLASRQRQLSEQSQLIGDAATSARLISEISGSLTKVRGLKTEKDNNVPESAVVTASSELTSMQKKVNAVIARLNVSEARIRQMRKDNVAHAAWDTTQVAQIREYERSLAQLRASVEQQRGEIALLTQRVDSVSRVNVALAARGDSVVAVNHAMAAHEDSVFVAIGTEKELVAKGIVRKEGGTKFFFGRGKSLVPGRTLDRTAFMVISKNRDHAITLPVSDKEYQVVSRQDLAFTDTPAARKSKVRGAIHIIDPERFWAPSRYLILVQR